MRFQDLNEHIERAWGELHTVRTVLFEDWDQQVEVLTPGKYQDVTDGGDFVVVVTDGQAGWTNRKFRHVDLFDDFALKAAASQSDTERLLTQAAWCCTDAGDPSLLQDRAALPGLYEATVFHSLQALCLAEHRRYAQHESGGGGRWLPLRFIAGIVAQRWTAAEAAREEKSGMPGLRRMEHRARRMTDANHDATGASPAT